MTCIPTTQIVEGTHISLARSSTDIKKLIKQYTNHKFYRKATHNTYAWRITLNDGSIIDGKNDDGETGAGQCILRELRRVNVVDGIVIVTRYYGGVKLQNDRFKHVIDATKHLIQHITTSQ